MNQPKKKLKAIPKFASEDAERDFWATHDSTEYIDWSTATVNPSFPNLKPSTKSITLRLSETMLNMLRSLANKRDVPYQSLLKVLLAEKLRDEYKAEQDFEKNSK